MDNFKQNSAAVKLTDKQRVNAIAGLQRMDKYVQASLSGMLSNPAWNSEQATLYLRAKKLTLEQLAVASAMEAIIQVDKFLKGEAGGDEEALNSSPIFNPNKES